jgi:predicted MPP superfamily phosphohydrolase
VRVLRNEHVVIERDGSSLILAGVEDTWVGRVDLGEALRSRPPGVTVLMVHDPAVFDEAARCGVSLVLSGHTHGGQIALPGLARYVNLTRLSNRYSLGVYRRHTSTLVVNGGLGVTGLPMRVGVAPEALLLRLRSALNPNLDGSGAGG